MKGKYRSGHFNRIKHTGLRRMIAVLLCICTLIPIFQAKTTTTAFAAEETDAVKITYEGETVKDLTLPQDERLTVKAEYAAGTSEVTYQWQILADIQSDFWVDIYDGKEQSLTLSYSMLVSLLDDADSAYVRCKVTDGGNAVYSDGVWVTVTYTDQVTTVPEAVVTPQTTAKRAPLRAPKAGSEYVDITINYLDAITGAEVFTNFHAQIAKRSTYTNNVISPTLLGYAAYYNAGNPTITVPGDNKEVEASDDATVIHININESYTDDTYVINVYYKAIEVPYGIRYYFQNINDDQYTEHTDLYKSKKAKTGMIISDEELKLSGSEGFTKLYHYPEAVAADGSTVFQCYYDRNYYILKFDMDGGYGIDPIYARYGTPFVVADPVRHGYVFKGWADVTDDPESTTIATLPGTVPAANKSYKAIWEVAKTHYTKVYWLQNADDDGYSYVGSVTMNNVESGSVVSGENDLTGTTPVCNSSVEGHTHTTDCYPTDFKYYVYNNDKTDKNVTVSGDGSTIVNIYYNRREYNLNFYYAREKDEKIEIVGGTTHPFGNKKQTEPNPYTIDNLLSKVNDWGKVKSLPEISADYKSVYVEPKTREANGYTYYYLTLHGRYGEDISDKWPGTVFDKVGIDYSRTEAYGYSGNECQNKMDGEWKNYAYMAGWNGEFRVKYTKDNENSTIKGMFQKLDEELLRQDDAAVTEVNFLGFFDNGANIRWSFPYQWIYELYVPVMEGDTSDLSYGGVDYKKIKSIDTVDNNAGIGDQTQPTLNGFTKNGSDKVENSNYTADGRKSFTAWFFYKRDDYTITYHNYNKVLRTISLPFETSLEKYIAIPPKYPDTLEKDAYVFAGWYYTAGCYDGTECKATDKMPANDIALYAKWKPVTYTVNFFQTYDDMLNYNPEATPSTNLYATRKVEHGKVIAEEVTNPTDKTGNDYSFSGWFYIENGKKKAYTPSGTPVTSNLNVFADWGSHTAQPYKVHYVLYEKETDSTWTGFLAAAAASSPSDNKTYTVINGTEKRNYVYLASDKGYHLQIADDANGYAYQGNTRTFYAKAGAPYNQLYNTYNTGFYPTVASHSISIEYEGNKVEPEKNVYTFTYVHAENVGYTVEYRYADTNQLITTAGKNGVKETSSTNAVVTERFAVVSGYIPDAFYKRLILAVQVDSTGKFVSSPDNKLVFYYSKNEENAYYAVHYMLQNLDATSDSLENDTYGNYKNYTESDAHTEGIAEINSTREIIAQDFGGFTVKDKALAYDAEGSDEADKQLKTSTDGKTKYFDVTIRAKGTEIYIFYTRNMQNYKVYYLKYNTNIDNLDSLTFNPSDPTHANGVLAKTKTGSAKFGKTVTEEAVNIAGMNCVSKTTQKLQIRSDNNQNHIIFYYSPLQYQANYKVWSQGGGKLSATIEVKEGEGEFKGSVPTADKGYKFDGWYTDEACTTAVTDEAIVDFSNKLIPIKAKMKPKPKETTFYAKFVPVLGDLTITRAGANDEGYGDQIFTYRITAPDDPSFEMYVSIQGNSSVTIKDMLCKEYKIEQQNDWSWRYEDTSQTITLSETTANKVSFGIMPNNKKWLNGNSNKLVNRKE